MKGSEMKELKKIFQVLDKDGSGTITFDELSRGLSQMGASGSKTTYSKEQVEELMKSIDFDGNGQIEYEEFVAATIQLGQATQPDRLRAAFQHFDRDGSG